jgi:acyl CoA:acetate/3-ketoacid CoA transferase alpha subunit
VEEAVAKIEDGVSLLISGFMAVGTPEYDIDEIGRQGKRDLIVIANDGHAGYRDRRAHCMMSVPCGTRSTIRLPAIIFRCVSGLSPMWLATTFFTSLASPRVSRNADMNRG